MTTLTEIMAPYIRAYQKQQDTERLDQISAAAGTSEPDIVTEVEGASWKQDWIVAVSCCVG